MRINYVEVNQALLGNIVLDESCPQLRCVQTFLQQWAWDNDGAIFLDEEFRAVMRDWELLELKWKSLADERNEK